jgi:glutathione S-transferase
LDLNVERVVPCGTNSRNNRDVRAEGRAEIIPPTLVVEADGTRIVLSSADDILRFLDENFAVASTGGREVAEIEGDDDEDRTDAGETSSALRKIERAMSSFTSFLPSALRLGRGSAVCSASMSSHSTPMSTSRTLLPLVLYSYEGNQFCRLVREVLTELDLVYELRSCGKGSRRREELANLTGGSTQCPYLIDPNNEGVAMAESGDIVGALSSL